MSAAACRHSLRAGSRTLGFLPSSGQTRYFSSTPSRAGKTVIQFHPGGNVELKKMLGDIYDNVILPEYLTEEQRKKIYRPKYKKDLERDPITIEIDGKKHEFRYRDMIRDLPSTKKGVVGAVKLMTTRAEFDNNLFPLLEGVYSVAKRKPAPPAAFIKIIRSASNVGSVGAVLKCVYNAKETKFFLQTHEMINELFHQLQSEAWESGWEPMKIKKNLVRMQKVLDVLEADAVHHAPLPDSGPRSYPYYRDPQFLAARLHLHAAWALKHHGSKDLVAKYAQEIVRLWPQGFGLLDCHPDDAYGFENGMKYLLHRPTFIWTAVPIVSAFRMAQQVLAKDEKHAELVKALKDRAFQVEEEIRTARQTGKSKRASSVYKALLENAQVPKSP